MTNSNQSNKRAVTRFTALFICMILVCGIALPLFVFAENVIIHFSYDSSTTYKSLAIYQGEYIFNSRTIASTYRLDSGVVYSCLCRDGSHYYTPSYKINNSSIYLNLSNDPNNPTVFNSSDTILIYYNRTNESGSGYFIIQPSGYTLTFNSQGGSSISPLTGVSGIVHLGESGQYYPQYIPAKPAHNFVGWSLSENGTIVWDVDVQADTTLYAIWEQNTNYCMLHFNQSGFYSDYECTVPISQTQYVLKGTTVNFWAKKEDFHGSIASDQWCHFYGKITIWDDNNRSTNYTGINLYPNRPKNDENIFEFSIRVDHNYDIHPVFANLYRYNIKLVTDDYNELKLSINNFHFYAGDSTTDGWWESRDYATLGTDDVLGVNFEFDIQLPFIIFDSRIGLPDNVYVTNDNLSLYSDVIEDNSQYGAHINVHVVGNPYPCNMVDITTDVPTVFVYCKSIGEYDLTHDYHPVIRYDESGEAQWNFEQVSLLDTDWSEVNENIPTKLNSFFGGLFSLSGLAVLIPMVMMVSFAIWFIRRS